jgi:hypothetical protein
LSDSDGCPIGQSIGDLRVVPAHARVGRLVVRRGAQVAESARSDNTAKPVREAFRHPEVALVVGAEDHAGVLAEGRRAAADVDRDVEHLASSTLTSLPCGFGHW